MLAAKPLTNKGQIITIHIAVHNMLYLFLLCSFISLVHWYKGHREGKLLNAISGGLGAYLSRFGVKLSLLREAAKKALFLVVRPLRPLVVIRNYFFFFSS